MARARHHYVPQCYLKRWADLAGKVACLFADENDKIAATRPINLGFQRYYYSQPTQDGTQENDKLEDFFSKTESDFSIVADNIQSNVEISKADFHTLMNFVSSMHARVPAMRDCIEHFLASRVVSAIKQLEAKGEIQPHPSTGLSLLQAAQITIDPHRSLHAMSEIIKGFAGIIGRLGFRIIQNETEVPFITSDNPVVMFDPMKSDTPYISQESAHVVIFFPISPHHLLYGASEPWDDFQPSGRPWVSLCDDTNKIVMFNEKIAQFGYRQIYATTKDQLENYKAYSATSPVMETIWLERNRNLVPIRNWAFDQRPRLPKWKGRGPN